jgi:hypothetical protein
MGYQRRLFRLLAPYFLTIKRWGQLSEWNEFDLAQRARNDKNAPVALKTK